MKKKSGHKKKKVFACKIEFVNTMALWWSQLVPHDAERRQSLRILCVQSLSFFRFQVYSPTENFPLPRFSVATLFWFVARFARVRIEGSSRNRFAWTAYFTNPGTFRGEFFGRGEYSGHRFSSLDKQCC